MPDSNTIKLIVTGVVLLVVFGALGKGNVKMFWGQGLVVKERNIDPNGPCYVRLVGRRAGLIGFLMALIGIDPTTVFELYSNRISIQFASLAGTEVREIPLQSVSISSACYRKPMWALFTGILLALGAVCSLAAAAWIFLCLLVAAGIFFLIYYFNKRLHLVFYSHSGWFIPIGFKPSLIENKNVTYEDALQVISMVNQLITYQNQKD